MARNALGLEFGSAAQLSKRPGNMWNCIWGHALKRSPGIIRKSRVSYPVPGFLSNATWPLLPKKPYNGLINYIVENSHCWTNRGIGCKMGQCENVHHMTNNNQGRSAVVLHDQGLYSLLMRNLA